MAKGIKQLRPNQIPTQSGFNTDWGDVKLSPRGVGLTTQEDLAVAQENNELIQYLSSPEYQKEQTQELNKVLKTVLGKNLFTEENQIDTKATPFTTEEFDLLRPEQKPFAQLFNELYENKGVVYEEDFLSKALNRSMTNGWVEMISGYSMGDSVKGVKLNNKGFTYEDKQLSLSPEETKVLSDFYNIKKGLDHQNSFIEDVAEIAASLVVDLPLMYITGAGLGGIMKATTIGKAALMANEGFLGRTVNQAVQQAVQFNIMGIPQTVDAVDEHGAGGGFLAIANNAKMGALGAVTGSMGRKMASSSILRILKDRPALADELGTVTGAFGFGTLSGKIEGESWRDALANGLAFAGTHFTNPSSMRRVLAEQGRSGKPIYTELWDGQGNPTDFSQSYFIEESGKLYKIDAKKMMVDGDIKKVSTEPVELTDRYARYNEVDNHVLMTFGEALSNERLSKASKEIYDGWVKELPEDYVEANKDKLQMLSLSTAGQVIVGRTDKLFSRVNLPETVELNDKMINLANDWHLPYSEVKKFVVSNIESYFNDPENFRTRLEESPLIAKDFQGMIDITAKSIIKEAQQGAAKELVRKITTAPFPKLLTAGDKEFQIDLSQRAKEVRRKLEANLKAQGVTLPSEKVTYYEFEGELIPIETKGDKATIYGTNIVMDKDVIKGKTKTAEQLKQETIEVKPTAEENKYVSEGIKQYQDKQLSLGIKPTPDELLQETRRLRGEYGKEQMGKPENIEAGIGGETARPGGGNRNINVEGTEQSGRTVNEETSQLEKSYRVQQKGETDITKTVGYTATEGEGYYVSSHQPTLDFFSSKPGTEIKSVSYEKPRNPIRADYLYLLNENPEIEKPIKASDSEWLKLNKQAYQNVGKWDVEKINKELTKLLKEKGYDAVEVQKEAGNEFTVLLDENLIKKPSQIEKNALEAQGKANVGKPIQTLAESEIVQPTRSKEAVFEDKIESSKQNASDLASSVRDAKRGYSEPDIKGKIDRVFADAIEIAKDINESDPKAKVRPNQIISHMMKLQGLSDNQIAGIISQREPNTKYWHVSGYRSKNIGGRWISENLVDELRPTQVAAQEITPSESIQAGLNISKPNVTEIRKASELTEILDSAKKTMEADNYNPLVRNDIETAKQLGTIDEAQYTSLIKNLKNIETTSRGADADKSLQLLEQLYADGKIDKKKYEDTKRVLLENKDLFEEQNNMFETLNQSPENRTQIENELHDIFGNRVIVRWDSILPEGKTARTFIDADGNIHIDFTNLASVKAPLEERIHAQALLTTDQLTLDKVLKELTPEYDGIEGSVSWRAAHEKLAENAIANQKDSYGIVDRIRETWEKLKNFFSSKGWYSTSEWYRKLLNGEIDLKEKSVTFADDYSLANAYYGDKTLYETRPVDMKSLSPEEHADQLLELTNEFYRYKTLMRVPGEHGAPSLMMGFRNNKIVRKIVGVTDLLQKAALQNRNIADRINKDGSIINSYTHKTYHMLEKNVVLKTHEDINKLLESKAGWNLGKDLRLLPNKESYTAKVGKHFNDIADGKAEPILPQDIAKGETLDQFIDRASAVLNYTPAEKAVEKHIQISARETQQQRRTGYEDFIRKDLVDSEGKPIVADGLTKTELKSIFGDILDYSANEPDLYKSANEKLAVDKDLMNKVVGLMVDKFAPNYYGLYRNDVRPSDPSYYSIVGDKPLDKDGNIAKRPEDIVSWQKFNSYGKTKEEADKRARHFINEGFSITGIDRIGDLITREQYDRLTANQLMNLVDVGRINPSEPVIRALLNATKTGNYEQHTINKKYIKGMYYTPEELEMGMQSLIKESVNASTKRFGLAEVRGMLANNRGELNAKLQSVIVPDYEKDRFRRDYDYATQIYNQVSHSDQSFIDAWRQGATAWYVGMKPSFWFQQMMQPLQTALPEAIAETKNSTLNGTKVWTDAFGKALELGRYIQAEKKGVPIQTTLDRELIDLYYRLDAQALMGAVGIEELTGKGKDIQMRYGSDMYKNWNRLIKIANLGGAAAEKYTRLQALSTFYDIGKSKNLSGSELTDYVTQKVKDVMGGWGALDRPAVFQSKQLGRNEQKILKAIDKAFFTFKTYSNTNLGQYDRLFRGKAAGSAGLKAIIGVGMHGVTRLPLAATIFALANLFTDDDSEYETLKFLDELDDTIGYKAGSILAKGIPSLSGINFQNLFDERTSFATDVFAETRSSSVEGKLAEAMFGAPYGLIKDIVASGDAAVKLVSSRIADDPLLDEEEKKRAVRNLNKILPLTFRNVISSYSLAEDGVEIRGKEIIKSDDISWSDVVYKVLGFNPMTVSDAYEYQFAGTPAKLSRARGKQIELKKIRKEINASTDYDADTKNRELKKISDMLKEAIKEEAILTKQLNQEKRG